MKWRLMLFVAISMSFIPPVFAAEDVFTFAAEYPQKTKGENTHFSGKSISCSRRDSGKNHKPNNVVVVRHDASAATSGR